MPARSGLESALRNLVENAASFAAAQVRVVVRCTGARVEVEVRAVAEAHAGSVAVGRATLGGARFTLELPQRQR